MAISCLIVCKTLLIITINAVISVNGLSDVYQEALLHPYRTYADVAIFHYYAPSQTIRAIWQFAAFSDDGSCPQRKVHIFLQHESYPVINPDNSSYPDEMYISQGQVYQLETNTQYRVKDALLFSIYNPLPGNWFAVGYIPDWNHEIKQQGFSHKCRYSLDSIASWISYDHVSLLTPDVPVTVTTDDNRSYFKFYVPENIWSFDVDIYDCASKRMPSNGTSCLMSFGISARSLPFPKDINETIYHRHYIHRDVQPQTDSYYYIAASTRFPESTFTIIVRMQECIRIWETGVKMTEDMFNKFKAIPVDVTYSSEHGKSRDVHDNWKRRFNTNSTVSGNFSMAFANGTIESEPEADQREDGYRKQMCFPVLPLARIKHAQDFLDTFVLQDKNWFSTWLSLTDKCPILTRLKLLPFVDIGGSLQVNVTLDQSSSSDNVTSAVVQSCISHANVPEFDAESSDIICKPGLDLSLDDDNPSGVKYIPYPHPGLYYVSFKARCYNNNGTVVPCGADRVSVHLRIRLQPCVFESLPCGLHGYCVENHRGQFFFSSCHCVAGWKGIGCTDGSDAIPAYVLLMQTLLLTLSNLFFLPAIVLATKRRFFAEALLYTFTMCMSTFYHACDEMYYSYCLMKFEVLQFCDFFSAILSFWVTLVAMADLPWKMLSVAHMAGALGISLGVESQRTGLWVFIVPVAAGVTLLLVSQVRNCWKAKSCRNKMRWKSIVRIIFGLLLIGSGLILFAFVETQRNYKYVHSAWHVVVAISILLLLPGRRQSSEVSNENGGSICHSIQSNDSELLDINEYIVTSDLDVLVVDPSNN